MVEYTESNYRFTNPIRYFKANDPIYYEVDNIPLKQLQENDLWLKDQLNATTSKVNSIRTEIDRSSFTELKPYCEGGDNIIKVKPGRFTARINDAYNLTPLQIITQLTGGEVGTLDPSANYNSWNAKYLNDNTLSSIIYKFRQQTILSDSLNMNGLVERAFSYPASFPDRVSSYLLSSTPGITNIKTANDIGQPPYPRIQAQLWNTTTSLDAQGRIATQFVIRQFDNETATVGFASLGAAESEFIKKWRGVARTSVVDVPDELTIEVPRFDINDFYYINESNQRVVLDQATQRIDLLFVYSKPVDASGTTVAKFDSTGRPRVMTRAELGIVRGAGIGVDFRSSSRPFKLLTDGTVSNDGSLKILPHISDQAGVNTGFRVSGVDIKGSFPSPDDLMNLTPLLDENLVTNHYALIGQSILPIAYIVVKKDANLSNGLSIITNSDIIDIRPFFRTTELSYNERAGIAAAVPAPSLANPIVTQAELDYEIRKVYATIAPQLPQNNDGLNRFTQPRPIANGVIHGGFYYGVEGTLGRALYVDNISMSVATIKETVKNLYNYPADIPDQPDWDIAKWCDTTYTDRGLLPNDRINYFIYRSYDNNWDKLRFGPLKDYPTGASDWRNVPIIDRIGIGFDDYNQTGPRDPIQIYFVKKTIKLQGLSTLGVGKYDVNVNLLNCVPFYNPNAWPTNDGDFNMVQGVWVEKSKPAVNSTEDSFTIYVAWSPKIKSTRLGNSSNPIPIGGDPTAGLAGASIYSDITPENNRRNTNTNVVITPGFAVINNLVSLGDTRGNAYDITYGQSHTSNNNKPWLFSNSKQQAEIGLATYPTVQFQVIGYPTDWAGTNKVSLAGASVISIA